MRQLKRARMRINAVCLLILFMMYQAGYAAFLHVHYVDGVPVVHSHPFHAAHGHTQASLLSIGQEAPLTSTVGGEAVCCLPFLVLLAVLCSRLLLGLAIRRSWLSLTLRAPPVSFFIR